MAKSFQRVHFVGRFPEFETIDSNSIAGYCSEVCKEANVTEVLANEGVLILAVHPDIGPVETGALCKGPVDLAKFPLTYS